MKNIQLEFCHVYAMLNTCRCLTLGLLLVLYCCIFGTKKGLKPWKNLIITHPHINSLNSGSIQS